MIDVQNKLEGAKGLEQKVKRSFTPAIGWLPLIVGATYYFIKDPSFGKAFVTAGAYLAEVSTLLYTYTKK